MLLFPFYKQLNSMDCGATCLKMVARFYGKSYKSESLKKKAGSDKSGVSLLGIINAAESIGFNAIAYQLNFLQLKDEAKAPCILHWNQNHFVVLVPSRFTRKDKIKIADPEKGIIIYHKNEFIEHWCSNVDDQGEPIGTALMLEPGADFYDRRGEKQVGFSWKLIRAYLLSSKWQLFQVLLALIVTTCLQFLFPFLTQSLVDNGINGRNISFITLVLAAQLMLVFSRTIIDFIKSRLLLSISMVISLTILSDFWIKVTRLPLGYFDTHKTGDILQRVNDNKQIQNFLSGSLLNMVYSVFSFGVFVFILFSYNHLLFLIFLSSTIIYLLWIFLFLKIRRKINYQTFFTSAKENSSTLQLIQGMQDIKLNNAEDIKRWEWEEIQVRIFRLNFKTLSYNQLQQVGALFINQGKDVIITFLVARLVVEGSLTFGAMLAIQYIIGQLSSPIEQTVSFIQAAQDAKIGIERLNEIQQLDDEENKTTNYLEILPFERNIKFSKVSFAYAGADNDNIINNVSFEIPQGKTTAIVGASGSGKTTLLKLLLKFYDTYTGVILVGENDFQEFSHSHWREQCGTVLQDSYIFNDTILKNITIGKGEEDILKIKTACSSANILSFIESLPNGFNTLIGSDGMGISQGQKQRLLIARAIYKNPKYLFFDEATNALDATNEKLIVNNLKHISEGKTVVVVAHRLSTVKNADQIIVLESGCIAETGSHNELLSLKGKYFELVRNQLEIDS